MADNTKDPGLDLNKFEDWIENNKQMLSYIIGGIFIIVAGYLAFTKLYLAPKETDAENKMFVAQKYFEKDSLKLALNGDRNSPGFLQIEDDYKWTKASNLAHYYAGIIYLKQGKFQDAVDQLKSFSVNDKLVSTEAYGALGDAYTELNNFDEGVEYYKKAGYNNDNDMLSPIFLKKAGMALEHEKKYADAKKIYQDLQSKYPNTSEGREMDKYIAHVDGLM
jgi:tetratricopeptide (TPR) repeat protein